MDSHLAQCVCSRSDLTDFMDLNTKYKDSPFSLVLERNGAGIVVK